ncbi:MAG: DUF1080 domain-containing protein [Phycisphaerae bacterium]
MRIPALLTTLLAAALAATSCTADGAGKDTPAVASPAAKGTAAKDAGWNSLLPGKDLEGWKATGHAVWKVTGDGHLLGTQTDGRGGDLYTEKAYEDFELRFTYKVKWPANSGVWFRGKYQYDILKWKNPVGFSGTLYMPGWPKTFITRNLNEDLERRDGWNEGQVYAAGDHLMLWLNGTKTGDCQNDAHAKGPVGIQVHGGEQFKGMEIHFKRLEIRPIEPGAKPTPPLVPKAEK